MSHFDNLSRLIPDLISRRILDVGAGKGGFLIECARRGARAAGLEYNPAYINEAYAQARAAGLPLDMRQGAAEEMPYPDESFDFLNFSEVIEHVRSPRAVLNEAYRVLAPGGLAYLSVPNRFGLKDQHYHLYFVNWLPRSWSEGFIKFFGREKRDEGQAGRQKLSEMHYATLRSVRMLTKEAGFNCLDIRLLKLKKMFGSLYPLALLAYLPARSLYFDSFHLLLVKGSGSSRLQA